MVIVAGESGTACSQPTYKEWKQEPQEPQEAKEPEVPSLPTRNGNWCCLRL